MSNIDPNLSFDLGRIWCIAESNQTSIQGAVAFCHKQAGVEAGIPYEVMGFGNDCNQSNYQTVGYLPELVAKNFVAKYGQSIGNFKFQYVNNIGSCTPTTKKTAPTNNASTTNDSDLMKTIARAGIGVSFTIGGAIMISTGASLSVGIGVLIMLIGIIEALVA